MSDSVRPHRRQPTRLPHPWDSPGKNTGVGCHFLLQYMKVKSESEVAQSCPTLGDPIDGSLLGSYIHGVFQARVLERGAIAFSFLCIYAYVNSLWLTSSCKGDLRDWLFYMGPCRPPSLLFSFDPRLAYSGFGRSLWRQASDGRCPSRSLSLRARAAPALARNNINHIMIPLPCLKSSYDFPLS